MAQWAKEGVAHDQAAQAAQVDQPSQALDGGAEAVLGDDGQRDSVPAAGVDQPVGRLQRHVDRLLDDHVLARLGRADAHLGVQSAGDADRDGVHIGPAEQLVDVGVVLDAELDAALLGARRHRVGDRDQARVGQLGERAGVERRDDTAADDAEPERPICHWPASYSRPARDP